MQGFATPHALRTELMPEELWKVSTNAKMATTVAIGLTTMAAKV
jgi:hypothetical protein